MGLESAHPLRFVGRCLRQWLDNNPFPAWRTDLFFDDRKGYLMNSHNTDVTEFGLLLPNGQVLWNNYSNRSLDTLADREMMVQVLRKTAEECGFTENQFLTNYSWVSRRVRTEVTDLGTFALTDPEVIGVAVPADSEDDEAYDEHTGSGPTVAAADGHGGDLR